jgi:putative ABC transport system ATP-binding protein
MIALSRVSRVFKVGEQDVHALRDVTLTCRPGEYISVMGPSGSGKSSLLNILGLLDRPTSGLYQFENRDVTSLTDEAQALVRRNRIGFVFQFFHLIPRLTAAENVELPLVLAGTAPGERKIRVKDALAALGLKDRAGHRPDQLSGGERQRVAIARATIMRPAIILADEPTGNLDRTSGSEVVEILEDLNRQGILLIIVTHDPALGQRACRCITMTDGRVISDRSRSGPE